MVNRHCSCSHLSVSRSLWHGADGRDWCVGVGGGQRHRGQGGGPGLTLLPLMSHEGRQRIELFFTLSTQEHIFIICSKDQQNKRKNSDEWTEGHCCLLLSDIPLFYISIVLKVKCFGLQNVMVC